jgi:hypothetical protein
MNEPYPSDVGQAVQLLLYNLPYRDKVEVAIKTENELPKLQHSLGKHIQHEFGLDSNMSLIESCLSLSDNGVINSEDATQIILKTNPIRLQRQNRKRIFMPPLILRFYKLGASKRL